MQAPEYEKIIGIHVFSTKTPGIGGRLRKTPEDFIVQEIGLDGNIAPLEATNQPYPDQPGKFTAFFLIKRNIDSIQAIRRLAKVMGISYKRFSYAGIKDRRAVTSQRVTLYRAAPHELLGRDLPNIWILHPHRVAKPIVPGALWGNRFCIVIRHFKQQPKEALHQVQTIQREYEQKGGILNFFGPQRFGVIQPNTHLIGKQILLGNLEKAIQILLDKTPIEDPERATGNNAKRKGNSTTLRPHNSVTHQSYERAITNYLAKHPRDYQGAFRVLPKDLGRLYIHAYQAYLFNQTLSERVKRALPLNEATVGDFVMPRSGEIFAVRMVTKATITQTRDNIRKGHQKLVIPVIGYDFEHTELEGPIGEILSTLLQEEAISPGQFRLTNLTQLSSRGTFRPLLVQPQQFQSTLLEKDPESPIQVNFDLPKGSYASIVLREFIKPQCSTQL